MLLLYEVINSSTFTFTSSQPAVEKSQFLTLLDNYTAMSKEDTLALANAKNKYPYSQLLHTLTAYGMQKNDMEGKAMQLQLAAVYATDRSVLKAVFEAKPIINPAHTAQVAEQKKVIDLVVEEPIEKSNESIKVEDSLEGDELLAEIYKDITRLKAVKHAFELSAEAFDQNKKGNMATALHAEVKKKEKSKKQIKPSTRDTEEIIAEIKNSKKKIKPSDPKQKEQLEIIEQFIRTKPSIGKAKADQSAQADDLAENSTRFTENIISETLVEILVKQGKKDKAVEVLRKLIWKYPQKKAYFAAQIQELIS